MLSFYYTEKSFILVNLYGNLKFIKAFQKEKDGKQKDEGVSFHMKPTGWFRNGLETYSSVCKLQIAINNYAGEFIFIINIPHIQPDLENRS